MALQHAIHITSQGKLISSAAQSLELASRSSTKADDESDLLKSIRGALRGSGTEPVSAVHSSTFTHGWTETEITWDAHTVIMSSGGVMQKRWNFEEEGQPIQWACVGVYWLTSPMDSKLSAYSAARYTSDRDRDDPSKESTFGLFTLAQRERERGTERGMRCPAVFVFLRSIGKIFLLNGLEYTFSLPFIVRKAWALYPHGVMIQRVLDPTEVEEASNTGDTTLPTIFSVTSPFSEAASVGLTKGILGGCDTIPDTLKDEEENFTKPLKSVLATETIVWVSHRSPGATDDVLVTIDVEKRQLSIWRYVYIKPKDTPLPLGRSKIHKRTLLRKGASLSTGVLPGSRRASGIIPSQISQLSPLSPSTDSSDHPTQKNLPEMPPFSSLLGGPPALSTTPTMASLVPGTSSTEESGPRRRDSLTRNDLSVTMDRMVLGGRMDAEAALTPVEHGRMKAAYWMEKLHTLDIPRNDAQAWSKISVALFDQRWDGKSDRSLMGICLPSSKTLMTFALTRKKEGSKYETLSVSALSQTHAISIAPLRATRDTVWDAIVLRPGNELFLFTHGLCELPLVLDRKINTLDSMHIDESSHSRENNIVSIEDSTHSSVTLVYKDGSKTRVTIDLVPNDITTCQVFHVLAQTLSNEYSFALHKAFLEIWSGRNFSTSDGVEFDCFEEAVAKTFNLENVLPPSGSKENAWEALSLCQAHDRFVADPALSQLKVPPCLRKRTQFVHTTPPHRMLGPILYALHTMGEDMRLSPHRYEDLLRFASLICRIANIIRPEWADYWKRLCPDAMAGWPSPAATNIRHLDDRIPVWPIDMSALLYGRINNPDWKIPWHDTAALATFFDIDASFEYGRLEPLGSVYLLTRVYMCLASDKVKETQKRADNALQVLVKSGMGTGFINNLPLGVASPIREAARTCQLSPPSEWPGPAYRVIGRNDLAAGASQTPDILFNDGYKSTKDYITTSSSSRQSIGNLVVQAAASGSGEIETVSGVELDLEGFTEIRFGQDRRLEEVSRMLCSSNIPSVKIAERPELNEHDQAKEQENQVVRIAERTLALPYGRAMFTFGSVPRVTRESYAIPKIEYTIRMQPHNVLAAPEPGKIPQECTQWGEFHNGVAAGLRISPLTRGVESSWIAFNKPSELTPEHAGFLFGLGLTGHLKDMLTWHTFGYLTPKHDLTSIGVLLGLSAANVGSGNRHVTKLLAVHTPALLPTPNIDLNVSLMTQAAGLTGVGLLYMGTKDRHMADVCLNQISRKDLVQPDLSNEHREAYTYSASLAFGMTMLAQGSSIPADMAFLARLGVLIHGDSETTLMFKPRPTFDINLTSPAATIAIGLMYLRTERKDIADVLALPDTVLALNRIQPSFLLMRTVARSLILWDSIAPTHDWLSSQVPDSVAGAMRSHFNGKPVDDALELAYYNILAGCCFAIALKYAGTADQRAYVLIISYFDLFSRMVYSNNPAFDHKIKRSAIREGLNLISISLSMVMAGTGEISCFRRLRYAYGMYHQAFGYGVHVATHMSIGLLFLGGGRFTLGTSNAAIACMVAAFFPRFHHISSDNKSYLQALRHLWVLAVEPRCLIARDVDTSEVVYLPVKITVNDGHEVGTTQLISPTLIPDLNSLSSIRVDTPRYWPFLLDIQNQLFHKLALLRSQTLYVKRRTAFLSYTEDPKGSRSLFVRSGASSGGDAATLDFPQLTDIKTHPACDLTEFISSFSNDIIFLAFADHLVRESGETDGERIFHAYSHAVLLDSILQDKPQTLQTHLALYLYRTMSPRSRYHNLRVQDLKFTAEFYKILYDRRFSGRSENNPRPPLIRESTVMGALHSLDDRLNVIRDDPNFRTILGQYASGIDVAHTKDQSSQQLAWYLLRENVPGSAILALLKTLAQDAYAQCSNLAPPQGIAPSPADDPKLTKMRARNLDVGIKEVLHGAGSKMVNATGAGWSVRSLEDIIDAWKLY